MAKTMQSFPRIKNNLYLCTHITYSKASKLFATVLKGDQGDPNPKNKRFIHCLYHRNRRKAVRLIMSKSQPQCELEPEILAKSFFPEESLLPDPEIFNVLEKILDPADLSHFSKNYKYSYFYSGTGYFYNRTVFFC